MTLCITGHAPSVTASLAEGVAVRVAGHRPNG